MRILVTGSDGPGGVIATQLDTAGHDVTLLERPRRAFFLDMQMLVVRSDLGNYRGTIRHIEAAEIFGVFDMIIVTCCAHEVDDLSLVLPRAVGENTTIVSLVTGLRHLDKLRVACPTATIIDGMHDLVVLVGEDGEVVQTGATDLIVVGATKAEDVGRLAQFKALFVNTNLLVKLSPNMDQNRWERVARVVTVAGLAALMSGRMERISEVDAGATHIWQIASEMSLVATASGYPLDVVELASFLERLPRVLPATVNKVLSDVEAGDLGEIGALATEVQGDARKANVPAPLLDVIVTAINVRAAQKPLVTIKEAVPLTPAPPPRDGWFSRRAYRRKKGAEA